MNIKKFIYQISEGSFYEDLEFEPLGIERLDYLLVEKGIYIACYSESMTLDEFKIKVDNSDLVYQLTTIWKGYSLVDNTYELKPFSVVERDSEEQIQEVIRLSDANDIQILDSYFSISDWVNKVSDYSFVFEFEKHKIFMAHTINQKLVELNSSLERLDTTNLVTKHHSSSIDSHIETGVNPLNFTNSEIDMIRQIYVKCLARVPYLDFSTKFERPEALFELGKVDVIYRVQDGIGAIYIDNFKDEEYEVSLDNLIKELDVLFVKEV